MDDYNVDRIPPSSESSYPTTATSSRPTNHVDDAQPGFNDIKIVSTNKQDVVRLQTPISIEQHSTKRPSIDIEMESDSIQTQKKKKVSETKDNKNRSWLWDHFTKILKNGEKRAERSYCKIDVCGDSKSGTTVMKNHLLRCKEYPPNIDKKQRLLSLQSEQTQLHFNEGQCLTDIRKGKHEFWKFKQDDSRKAFAKMIIMDEMAFRFAER
ncbi:unnamed protein product [Amaranthus hypochondriacus]